MKLMPDPACKYNTFADAPKVGRACDEAYFFWYEDWFKDGSMTCYAQRKSRQLIKTPNLMGEHIRTQEPKVNMVVAEPTDFLRVNPTCDLGITGAMKAAHAAEGFGIDVELHGCGPAHRHCMVAPPNTTFYELGWVHPKISSRSGPIHANGHSDDLVAIGSSGCVPVPDAFGLGVAYNWDYFNAHRVTSQVYEP